MAEKKKTAPKKSAKKVKEEIKTQPLRKLTREEKMAYLIGSRKQERYEDTENTYDTCTEKIKNG